ncbi:hypothetical protein LIER_43080 [Lithospermum erythrorhizon]|uniref:Retrotransposon gag domain-containing protein n=1 Tax=Lithospermum erythrorhizon TaxID=34254 RepID=A0AAV3PIP0_LITER
MADAISTLQWQIDALSANIVGQARRRTNTELAGPILFSPEIRSVATPVGMKLLTFTKFTEKTDPEEHIAEFQSQMSFQHPCSKVNCRAFPSSLAKPALKWSNQLSEGYITSFEELQNRFTRTYVGMVRQDKKIAEFNLSDPSKSY